MLLIGLDIGTSTIAGVLYDAGTREVIRCQTRENPSAFGTDARETGQDAELIFSTVAGVLSELQGAAGEGIRAIGLTGQMHGILYTDRNGRAVSRLFTWQDESGNRPYSDNVTFSGQLGRVTGYDVPAGYGLVTHYYHAIHGTVPPNAASLCTIADYAAMRLAGRTKPVTDPTNAAGLGLFHLKSLQFDFRAVEAAGIDAGLLPEIVPSGTPVGQTPDGIPVICALGDNQAGFLGSVRHIREEALVNVGTGAQISVFSDRIDNAEGLEARPFPGGGYLSVGAALGGGKTYALLETFFRDVCLEFAGIRTGSLYETMNRIAERHEPGNDELAVDARMYGTRRNPGVRGSIGNIGSGNWTPGHLVAGFLDGIVLELLDLYEHYPASIRERIRRICASGNGIRHNAALRRLLEKKFGLPLVSPPQAEEAAVGAALNAGVGSGVFRDFHLL